MGPCEAPNPPQLAGSVEQANNAHRQLTVVNVNHKDPQALLRIWKTNQHHIPHRPSTREAVECMEDELRLALAFPANS